jgi:hypothetical protein
LRDVPVFRIVNANDVVCTVPPEFLGFRHVGEEHRIGFVSRDPMQFDPASLWNRLITPIDMLADHAPINYVERI